MIADFGVNLPDGRSQLGLMRRSDENRREWQVTMSEGRNRQIRRTFEALGYSVVALHRTDFGPYTLGDLESGKFITVDKK
jgi:23S rRNA pseudouridine2605 synthase